MPETYLSDRQISARLSVHRTTPWLWAKAGTFPQPVKLSERCTRWKLSEIEAWEAAKAATSA